MSEYSNNSSGIIFTANKADTKADKKTDNKSNKSNDKKSKKWYNKKQFIKEQVLLRKNYVLMLTMVITIQRL